MGSLDEALSSAGSFLVVQAASSLPNCASPHSRRRCRRRYRRNPSSDGCSGAGRHRSSSKMVLTYTQEHVYRHPWDRVTSAAWRKFTDPEARSVLSHVVDVNTLSRRLDPSSGSLNTIRSITVRSPTLPLPLRPLLGGAAAAVVHCVEATAVDSRRRRMEVVSRNVGLRRLIEVEERSIYEPHPLEPERWTVFRQETRIRCKPLSALAAIAGNVEQKCAERFLQNSAKGREFVEKICRYLETEASVNAA